MGRNFPKRGGKDGIAAYEKVFIITYLREMKTKTMRDCLATVILFYLKGRGPHSVTLRDLAFHSEITSGGA